MTEGFVFERGGDVESQDAGGNSCRGAAFGRSDDTEIEAELERLLIGADVAIGRGIDKLKKNGRNRSWNGEGSVRRGMANGRKCRPRIGEEAVDIGGKVDGGLAWNRGD